MFKTLTILLLGDNHALLRIEDLAIGFMNHDMKAKLLNNRRLICMDSTHNVTRHKDLELTTILVKDEDGCGFPVAFLITNRKDQQIFEIFLTELKNVIGNIPATYFMSDDDIKFFNAWTNIMDPKPKRLLCSWHVKRNWCMQGMLRKYENIK